MIFLLYSMIQAVRETAFTAYVTTEDTRIDNSVASSQIRCLFKFINDMDKAVFYAYGESEVILPRYTKVGFTWNVAPNMYLGETNLIPAGYFKYEIYEVSWRGVVSIGLGTAPATEIDVLPVLPANGVVQGLVGIGKLFLSEKAGSEQVQYNQHQSPAATNYIYYGQ